MTAGRESRLDGIGRTEPTSIDSIEDILVFTSDEEELEFWRTHEPGPKLLNLATHTTPEEILLSIRDLPER